MKKYFIIVNEKNQTWAACLDKSHAEDLLTQYGMFKKWDWKGEQFFIQEVIT